MVTDPDVAAVGKPFPPFKTPSPTQVARIRTEGLSMGRSCCLNFPAIWTSPRPISTQLTTGWTSRTGDSQSCRPQTSKCKLKEICVGPWAYSSSPMFYSFRSSLWIGCFLSSKWPITVAASSREGRSKALLNAPAYSQFPNTKHCTSLVSLRLSQFLVLICRVHRREEITSPASYRTAIFPSTFTGTRYIWPSRVVPAEWTFFVCTSTGVNRSGTRLRKRTH